MLLSDVRWLKSGMKASVSAEELSTNVDKSLEVKDFRCLQAGLGAPRLTRREGERLQLQSVA